MLDALLAGLRRRDRRALARLITLAARGGDLDGLRAQLGPPPAAAHVIAITGGGGVGKSTLVGKLIDQLRRCDKSVAVLACDPQSPLTGGALLGDRFRMPAAADAGVYVRSLAATSGRQAVADHLDAVVFLCEHFGFDFVLIETVGAGQGDTAVRALADAVVLLLQPETGDDLQWEKAGVLEVADVVVIHKADLPGSERAASQVKSALELAGGREVPVLQVSSRTGAGLTDLTAALEALPKRPRDAGAAAELLHLAQRELAERMRRPEMTALAAEWRAGRVGTAEALRRVFESQ
jgi:LAO/AO transport system ATPase